jgi:hypothetical protein
MAVPTERTEGSEETFEQKLARLRATSEERARLVASQRPFDYEEWVREAGPAMPEELAEMEEFLHEREVERRRSLASEEEQLARPGDEPTCAAGCRGRRYRRRLVSLQP